ncbi:outer membrane beta-barrel protein [Sphingobacterium bovisgrunnientis]|uniref:outer membrane beta-barrel protein n=1 Tax=Sphingobacterium bovisgrunnientis TaxID=1874697 RepID=UPI00186575E9|nr:outer membrane beta-barrel protein [Sphingobacterium bovisgrunnientis]
MKTYNKIIATLGLCILTSTTLNAQTVTTTTVVVEQTDTVKSNNKSFTILGESESNNNKYPRAFGGLTFSRIDWGFSRIMDDGAFSLSDENQFLKYKKASNFGFDIAQFGLRASDNFKTYISAGFEWNYLRLENNILLNENTSPISYTEIDPNDTDYSKNVFTTTYLRLPLTFEWRSDKNRKGERVKVAFGAMTGVLLKGTQRLKSKENGKQKFKDNYSLASFQYGPFVRLGYDDFGIFAKYYVNDFFEKSPAQKNLNNLAFGLTLGF